MQSPVGVPQRKSRIVGKAFRLLDILVQPPETAIHIQENKRMEGGMVGRSIKRFLCLSVGSYPVFLQFCIFIFAPEVLTEEMAVFTITSSPSPVAKERQAIRFFPQASRSLLNRDVL